MNAFLNGLAGQRQAVTTPHVAQMTVRELRRWGIAVVCAAACTTIPALASNAIFVPQHFATIQAAVNAAAPGTTIKIRGGTYTEEIVITKDLNLQGDGIGKTIIKSPPTLTPYAHDVNDNSPVAAVVRIAGGANVRMSELTLSGPVPCLNVSGISVVKGSTLNLSDSRVTLIRPADRLCVITFRSAAIAIGLPEFFAIDGDATAGSTGHGTVTNVTIDKFLGTGIAVLAPFAGPPSSTATISDNMVIGGETFATIQGGITIDFASVAQVTGNTIRGTVCTDLAVCGRDPINQFSSVGIGATLSLPGTVIAENIVSGNDVGIYLYGSDGCCLTHENTVTDNRFFGIVIQDGRNNIAENKISGGEVGVGVVADTVNTVAVLQRNKITRTSVAPVREISCCTFTATAIIDH